MDEIGRGTSTYDGLSLAWATAEYLAKNIAAKTLFATHYFEVTELVEQLDMLANVHLDAIEYQDTIAFKHTVLDGAASKSFGLQVASLAGVPKAVINRAKQKLSLLEQHQSVSEMPLTNVSSSPLPQQASLFDTPNPVLEELESIDPNELTPRQALDLIYQLKQLAKNS
jgi:DNA mismatch repair protein MutS